MGCFSEKAYCDFTNEDMETVPETQYGRSINLFLKTYKFADPSLGYHNYGVFKVTVFSEKTKSAVSDAIVYEQKSKADAVTFLDTVKINILVDMDWRGATGHEPDTKEAYYVEIEPLLAINEKDHSKNG